MTEHEIDLWKEVFCHVLAEIASSPGSGEEQQEERIFVAADYADAAVEELRKRTMRVSNPPPPPEDTGGYSEERPMTTVFPQRSIMPDGSHLCYRPCAHTYCVNLRAHLRLPCAKCGIVPPAGTVVHILERGGMSAVTKHFCDPCFQRQ